MQKVIYAGLLQALINNSQRSVTLKYFQKAIETIFQKSKRMKSRKAFRIDYQLRE